MRKYCAAAMSRLPVMEEKPPYGGTSTECTTDFSSFLPFFCRRGFQSAHYDNQADGQLICGRARLRFASGLQLSCQPPSTETTRLPVETLTQPYGMSQRHSVTAWVDFSFRQQTSSNPRVTECTRPAVIIPRPISLLSTI